MAKKSPWTSTLLDRLRGLVDEELTDKEIAARLGVSDRSVKDARLRNGMVKRTSGRPIYTQIEKDKIRVWASRGVSDTDIARRLGRHRSSVHRLRNQMGIEQKKPENQAVELCIECRAKPRSKTRRRCPTCENRRVYERRRLRVLTDPKAMEQQLKWARQSSKKNSQRLAQDRKWRQQHASYLVNRLLDAGLTYKEISEGVGVTSHSIRYWKAKTVTIDRTRLDRLIQFSSNLDLT